MCSSRYVLLVQSRQHVAGTPVGTDRRQHLIAHRLQYGSHLVRLALGAGQGRRIGGIRPPRVGKGAAEAFDRGIADDESPALESLPYLPPKLAGGELPDHRRPQRQRQLLATALPGDSANISSHGRFAVYSSTTRTIRSSCRAASLKSFGTMQLEERAAEALLPDRAVDLLPDQHLDQARLALMNDRLGARPLADIEETQAIGDRRARRPRRPPGSVGGCRADRQPAHRRSHLRRLLPCGVGDHQTRPVGRPAAVEQAPPPAFALLQLWPADQRDAVAAEQSGKSLGHPAQGIGGGDRRVLVQLDDVDPTDPDVTPGCLVESARWPR
jgi:hypothetical protein